jgi:protoporphyrinogen oxidase
MRRLVEGLLPGGWIEVRRRAAIWSNGVFTRYPYQVNTHGLPPEVVAENLLGFLEAHFGEEGRALREREPRDFGEHVLRHLGPGFARNFMTPYNTKLWTVPPSELSITWMGRFVPRPGVTEVVRGALGLEGDASGYNATFLYPRAGGIEALVEALARRLPLPAECGVSVVSIDPARRTALLTTGETVRWRSVIATAALPGVLDLLPAAPPAVRDAARSLRATTVTYVNVAARDVGGPPWHWVYLPEPRLLPYRVGSASAAVPGLAPPGHRSFYVEISASGPVPAVRAEEAAVATLLELGFLRSPTDVLFLETRRIPDAYVIHDHAWAASREVVRTWLAGQDILVAGRSGGWEYSSMEDALLAGRQAAGRLAAPAPGDLPATPPA